MANAPDFVAHVVGLARDAMEGRVGVVARGMFGGHGIYIDGTIVAIVIGDILYLKADDANRARFAAQGLEPFVYETRAGRKTVMSYHRAPDEALESPAAMAEWLRSALGAALRAAAAKPRAGHGADRPARVVRRPGRR
jgi:DNA transformation protein